ncbi:transposable element Tcb2 transposase [Trichonephila clavipes]|nr:transposable element Tcb2 transposase [Trichonephila clavipes]
MTWSIAKSPRVAEQCDVNIHSLTRQTSRREDRHIIRDARVEPTASLAAVRTQAASSLKRPLCLLETIARRMTKGHLVSRSSLRVLPMTLAHRRLRLEWCRVRRDWFTTKWNQVVFSNEYRFNVSTDDNSVRVGMPCDECLNPAFALQRHTPLTTGVMVLLLHDIIGQQC